MPDVVQGRLELIGTCCTGLSYSDLWILAGYTAIEEMGGPTIEFMGGRSDAVSESACPPEGRLPNAQAGDAPADTEETAEATAAHVRAIFYRMGFNDQEIVALLGAQPSLAVRMGRQTPKAPSHVSVPWKSMPLKAPPLSFRKMPSPC